jgi:RimJ/RimL family protein N-acetyltransferase
VKIVLNTPRLLLREMTPADLDVVAERLAHPEVMRFYPKLDSREEAEQRTERQLEQ